MYNLAPTRSQIVPLLLLLMLVSDRQCAAEILAPGAEHLVLQVGPAQSPANPNIVHIVKVSRSQKDLGLFVGTPNQRRNYAFKWPTSIIAAAYDSPVTGFDVLAATNGTFPRTGKAVLGANGDGTGLVSLPNTNSDHLAITNAGDTFILGAPKLTAAVLTLNDATTMSIDMLNELPEEESLACYTPQWGPNTSTSSQGIEIVLQNVTYPLRVNKRVTGVVSAVRTGADSINSAIPAGGMVLSARGTKAGLLQSAVSLGHRLHVEFEFNNSELNNALFYIAGAGQIISNGAVDTSKWTNDTNLRDFRHPRTILGYNATDIFLITIDGRQANSVGMDFQEMADYLLSLGLTDAVNLDGGGSSTMVVNGAVVNTPSDGSERAILNAVMLVKQPVPASTSFQDTFSSVQRNNA